jgi:hypothetical protein
MAELLILLEAGQTVHRREPRGLDARSVETITVALGHPRTARAIAVRFANFHAGKASARDPRALFR